MVEEQKDVSHGKTDHEMSLAIENLTAMLGIDDMDQAIELLSTNNWDESAAANQFYARQAQNEHNRAPVPNQASAGPQGANLDEHGQPVRAPIAQTEDQLIGGGPDVNPFAEIQAMQRRMMHDAEQERRRRASTNVGQGGQIPGAIVPAGQQNAKNYVFESMIDVTEDMTQADLDHQAKRMEEEKKNEEGQRPGVFRRAMRGVGNFFSSVFFCTDGEEDNEPQTVERLSAQVFAQFKADFDQYMVRMSHGQAQSFGLRIWDRSLSLLARESRAKKRPLLVMVLQDGDEAMNVAIKTMMGSEAARDLIKKKFVLVGVKTSNIPIPTLKDKLQVPHTSSGAFYFGFVTHDAKIRFMRRLVLRTGQANSVLYEFVTESKSLYDIMAEEDPQYRQVEMLQNAGILPVSSRQIQRNLQPSAANQLPQSFMGVPSPQQTPNMRHTHSQFEDPGASLMQQQLEEQRRQSMQYSTAQADPDALLRQQQKMEYEQAQQEDMLRQLERDQRETQERKEREEREQTERARTESLRQEEERLETIAEEKREQAATLMSLLPEEPEAGAPDVAEVVFRPPGSGKRVTRRFLKTDSVKLLYDFVRTLDEEAIAFDNPQAKFNLMQAMPRKVFEESEAVTLEQASIYPRALIQIQEIEEEEEEDE